MWLVFGESTYDTSAICRLVVGLRPEMKGRIESRRAPLVLVKGRRAAEQRKNAVEVSKVVKAAVSKGDRVVAVVAHQDCDDLEPSHEHIGAQIERQYAAAGIPSPIAATPAWEIETWWLLFPEAVQHIVPSWTRPDGHLGKDLGRIANSKEVLRRSVRNSRAQREYSETDSPAIAAAIVELGLLGSFAGDSRRSRVGRRLRVTKCASLGRLRDQVLAAPG